MQGRDISRSELPVVWLVGGKSGPLSGLMTCRLTVDHNLYLTKQVKRCIGDGAHLHKFRVCFFGNNPAINIVSITNQVMFMRAYRSTVYESIAKLKYIICRIPCTRLCTACQLALCNAEC